jgi:hypothetical protein
MGSDRRGATGIAQMVDINPPVPQGRIAAKCFRAAKLIWPTATLPVPGAVESPMTSQIWVDAPVPSRFDTAGDSGRFRRERLSLPWPFGCLRLRGRPFAGDRGRGVFPADRQADDAVGRIPLIGVSIYVR